MREIKFPGLGLELKINNIAISIGNVDIYWYAICIVLAFVIGCLFCKKDDGKYNIKYEDILELFIFVIPTSIIGARLYFVIFNLKDYINNPIEILNVRNGGLAIYGGIIAAIITICIYCKIKKMKVLDILDYIVPYLPLGQSIGRWGNFFNGEAHGVETNNFLRMGLIENGRYIEVHPTFLYESIACFIIFVILYNLKNKRKYKGQVTYTYLALYGLARTVIEGLRTDSIMIGDFRVSQVLSMILCLVFGLIIIIKNMKKDYENEK